MGWGVSLWICQTIDETISSRVLGVSTHNLLVDRRPAPDLSKGCTRTEYVDKFVSLARARLEAGDVAGAVNAELQRV
eukprot:9498208-Pyramimonas_sp.AAC.1